MGDGVRREVGERRRGEVRKGRERGSAEGEE